MREFFGFGEYQREPEGFMSWQHLVFVTSLVIIMTLLAVYLGRKTRGGTDKEKNRVLVWAALLIDGFELFFIYIFAFSSIFSAIRKRRVGVSALSLTENTLKLSLPIRASEVIFDT